VDDYPLLAANPSMLSCNLLTKSLGSQKHIEAMT
jgi:hypothetical protein